MQGKLHLHEASGTIYSTLQRNLCFRMFPSRNPRRCLRNCGLLLPNWPLLENLYQYQHATMQPLQPHGIQGNEATCVGKALNGSSVRFFGELRFQGFYTFHSALLMETPVKGAYGCVNPPSYVHSGTAYHAPLN